MSDYEIAADVAPGGLLEIYDVRILICYLLDSVDKPMTKDQLNHIFREERVVQYFTFSDALAQLVQDGHLSIQVKDGEEYYQLEPLGKGTAKRLQSVLSRAMRDISPLLHTNGLFLHDGVLTSVLSDTDRSFYRSWLAVQYYREHVAAYS